MKEISAKRKYELKHPEKKKQWQASYREKNRKQINEKQNKRRRETRIKLGLKIVERIPDYQIDYVKKNYKTKTWGLMAEELNITHGRIGNICKRFNLIMTAEDRSSKHLKIAKKRTFKDIEKQRQLGRSNGLKNPNQFPDGTIRVRGTKHPELAIRLRKIKEHNGN